MSDGYNGFRDYGDTGSDHAALSFLVEMMINRIATTTLVRVVAVKNAGELAPVGFLDAQPMIHQVDGEGNPTPHGVIHNIPYFRLQGGTNAVILDPAIDDIGIAMFCSRDIKQTARTKQPSAPASRRTHDWADGLYVGGVLNGVPTQYVRFSTSGVNIVSTNTITLAAPTLAFNGNIQMTGSVTSNGHDLSNTHRHLNSGGTGLGGIPQ